MSDISRLVVAWVSAQQRHYHQSTRGIATVEQRLEWEREAEEIIAAHDREAASGALRDAAARVNEFREGAEDYVRRVRMSARLLTSCSCVLAAGVVLSCYEQEW